MYSPAFKGQKTRNHTQVTGRRGGGEGSEITELVESRAFE